MNYFNENYTRESVSKESWVQQMVRVYGWMVTGLILTAIVSYFISESSLKYLFYRPFTYMALIISEVGLVWYLSSRAIKMDYSTATGIFMLYSVLNGITLSIILSIYTNVSIFLIFLMAASMFAFMSVYGLLTKQDLTGVGSFFIMGLFGLIIASVINMFMQNDTLTWIISYAGIAIFLGLTAYDSQKIKDMHFAFAGTEKEKNVAIIGALTLYLDFINLFMYLLRILGRRK